MKFTFCRKINFSFIELFRKKIWNYTNPRNEPEKYKVSHIRRVWHENSEDVGVSLFGNSQLKNYWNEAIRLTQIVFMQH